MGQSNLPTMRGDTPEAQESADIVNEILDVIRSTKGHTLYLGSREKYAILAIDRADLTYMHNDEEFMGWPVIWVMKTAYIRFV